MQKVIGIDGLNQCPTGEVAMTLTGSRVDNHAIPSVCIVGECYSIDEKMGNTYVHDNCANTLTRRDYKQPQAVIYELSESDRKLNGKRICEARNTGSIE